MHSSDYRSSRPCVCRRKPYPSRLRTPLCASAVTVLLLTGLLLSCRPPAEPAVRILTEPETREAATQFLERHPLPEEFKLLSPDNSSAGEERLAVYATLTFSKSRVLPQPDPQIKGFPAEGGTENDTRTLLLEREYRAPRVALWDARYSVSLAEALQMETVPLDAISPPDKALAVEGRYPGEHNYPLEWRSTLRFAPGGAAGHESGEALLPERKQQLLHWFSKAADRHEQPRRAELIRIGGVGDMMVGRGLQSMLIERGAAGRTAVFGNTLPLLARQDLLLGNLEGAVTTRGTPTPKSYTFRFRPEVLPELRAVGFDYLSLTNNHCWDYGLQGFTDTLAHLERHGISTSGAGLTPTEVRSPSRFDINGRRVHVLSVGAYPQEKNGFNGRVQATVTAERPGILFSGQGALEAIRSFAGKESIDVVMVHGGVEWRSTPTEEQRSFYRSLEKAGADLILGSHPHLLQGMEGQGDGLIAYSLGNFLFPGMYVVPKAEESMLLSVLFYRDRPLYVESYPVRIDHRRISLDTDGTILKRYMQLTRELHPDAGDK